MKADIVGIGSFDKDGNPQGWCFDCDQAVPAIEIRGGKVLYGGYSASELVEITDSSVTVYNSAALEKCSGKEIVGVNSDQLPYSFTLHLGDGSLLVVEVLQTGWLTPDELEIKCHNVKTKE